MQRNRLQTVLFYAGISLIGLAALALVLNLSGLLAFPETILGGENTLHSLARAAVTGCMLAAIGSWEPTSTT